ncbi:hypothetical protein NUU61_008916 [Penicillium alfredii]|uniref:Uncharacterized protein n=1 Tax=Penicillium alfredii TaxID=1506179 RepID=A0A9W9EM40_9EURO|nr:uncharacterized protein NUU61_008916 [Penicillium alfredii]KAJ5084337.1 hypothetical protein NUU61_008916 [Penicillium alfredii]
MAESQFQLESSSRLYHVYKTSFQRHYDIKSDDQPLCHGEVSLFTPNKPDLILHAGANNQAPVVAVCKFLKLSGSYKLGLGDPDDLHNVQWEDMTRENTLGSKYRFEMTLPSLGDGPGERRSFWWKRTRTVAVDGAAPPKWWSDRNYKLVDEQTEQVLAVFTSERTYHKCGKIQVMVEYGKNFDTMIFISCLTMYEKDKRRDNRGAGSGGGGGG